MSKWLKSGNHKLESNIKIWSIPAGKEVCGRECKGCYAIKAQKGQWGKTVVEARNKRLDFSKSSKFVPELSREIKGYRTAKYVRIHESGEFYSQEYIDNWAKIASNNPKVVFYTYTKRLKEFNFKKLKALPNVVVIDSLKFGSLNYGKEEVVKPLSKEMGSFLCPDHKTKDKICGTKCTYCMTKKAQENGVFFVKH